MLRIGIFRQLHLDNLRVRVLFVSLALSPEFKLLNCTNLLYKVKLKLEIGHDGCKQIRNCMLITKMQICIDNPPQTR